MLSRVFLDMSNYKTSQTLSDGTIAYIKNVLKAYRELGVKVYLNIYYQAGHDDTIVTADIVLKHLDYYEQVLEEFKDTIYCYCVSLIGSWGEWTSTNNGVGDILGITEEQKQQIADKVLDILPEGMYMTVRQPEIKTKFFGDSQVSIGLDQSAFFGYDYTDNDIGQGNFRPGTDAYSQAVSKAAYSIMAAETFTTRWFRENTAYAKIDALNAIKALSEQRITSFNVNHAYGDIATYGGNIEDTVLYGWRLEKVTASALNNLGVLCTDGWFKASNGKTVTRSAFDYIRDYLGYRISAESLTVTGGNEKTINVSMNLKNYGFSAAFNLKSGFAVLDENNNVISKVYAGKPSTWYCTDPDDYSNRTQLVHTVTASMNLPEEAGNYKLAFFMENTLGQSARLDNLIEYGNGFNILHIFTVS